MVRLRRPTEESKEGLTLAQSFITGGFDSFKAPTVDVTPIHLPVSQSAPRLTRREKDIMSLPWSKGYAAAATAMPQLQTAADPLPLLPPVDATRLFSADAAEDGEAVGEETGEDEEAAAGRTHPLPTAHELVSSVRSTLGERFDRYSATLLTNSVGGERLRRTDACSLIDANVHDFGDLKALSAHLRGLVDEVEQRHQLSEQLRQAQRAEAAAAAEEERARREAAAAAEYAAAAEEAELSFLAATALLWLLPCRLGFHHLRVGSVFRYII